MFLLGFAVDCLAQVTWSYNLDDKNCDVFIQVNEGKNVLYLETMHIPGQYMTTSLWGTSATMCHINENDESYINGMKRNGAVTFLNNENQICFFENLGFSTGNMGGFYVQPWSYVYGVNIRVSCEDSSSIPLYCAKTEKMAQQVLLAREELECAEKDGNFEGGVYPFEMPNGETEYCVAGRCDVCNSKWYKNFVDHWKDSVCCESRRKEPNTNNGTCVSPPPFDSTKIGVNHSKITAFPGCSNAKAGKNNNFCFRSSSSSVSSSSTASSSSVIFSSSWSSSSSTASSSSNGFSSSWNSSSSTVSSSSVSSSSNESSSSEYSSSSEDSSSSSEEQEPGSCYPNSSDAQQALRNAEAECWSMQKESSFKLDDNGCLTGECYGGIYSSDDGGESSSSEAESSSSEEERCIDVSLKKKNSDDEEDPWTYVGKEKYTSKTVTYEEPVASSGIFDALGRMYTMVKSKIKYYMGLDSKVTKTRTLDSGEEMEVWKKKEVRDGKEIESYRKTSKDGSIEIDSLVYKNGLYDVIEVNLQENYYRHIDTSKIVFFVQYENNDQIKELFVIGLKDDEIYDKDGFLKPNFEKVRNDTIFFDVEYLNYSSVPSKNVASLRKESSNRILAKKTFSCSGKFGLTEDPTIPKAECMRFDYSDIGKDDLLKTGKIFAPGAGNDATFGKTTVAFYRKGFSCVLGCEKDGQKLYYHIPTTIVFNEKIIVMASNWKKDKTTNTWNELCWTTKDMQATYDHEAQHVRNARIKAKQLFYKFMITEEKEPMYKFKTEEGCENKGSIIMWRVRGEFLNWSALEEFTHESKGEKIDEKYGTFDIPASPTPTSQERKAITCPSK